MGRFVSRAKAALEQVIGLASAAVARTRLGLGRSVRFSGAFASRDAALASLKPADRVAYDRTDISEVSLAAMVRLMTWDYPVIFWLDRIQRAGARTLAVLDAGGHVGTKYLAFRGHLSMSSFDWSIWDLPALLRSGRAGQRSGTVPDAIRFIERLADAGPVDVLLGSGLMQYIDISLADLVNALPARPAWILLNKVATRPGPELVTIERIGPGRVPYRIRNETAFEAEIAALGYDILDQWSIPELGHRIETHPWLGTSVSKGYLLRLRRPPVQSRKCGEIEGGLVAG